MRRTEWLIAISLLLISGRSIHAQTTGTSIPYIFPDRGAVSFTTVGAPNVLTTGYARVQPNVGNTTATSVAILSFHANGVLVSDAAVQGAEPMLSGRTYAEVNGPINTGIAIANPNSLPVSVSFTVVNSSGATARQGSFTIGANQQISAFLNEAPFSVTGAFVGALSFNATAAVGVIALRSLVNEVGEFLMTTQAVAPTSAGFSEVVLGHFADGGGWKTRVLLVNPTDSPITGSVQFFGQGSGTIPATPLILSVEGRVGSTFSYSIPPRASARLETGGLGVTTQVGSIRITPFGGSPSPISFAEFVLRTGGITVTQASVLARPVATTFRTFVESGLDAAAAIKTQTAIAITNMSTTTATVTLELFNETGVATGLRAIVTIPGSGHVSRFLHELFPTAPLTFRGVLRGTGERTPLGVVALLTRNNEVGRFLVTTLPVSDEALPAKTAEVILPQITIGDGFTTQFVLFSGTAGQSSHGSIRFFDRSGQQLTVAVD